MDIRGRASLEVTKILELPNQTFLAIYLFQKVEKLEIGSDAFVVCRIAHSPSEQKVVCSNSVREATTHGESCALLKHLTSPFWNGPLNRKFSVK